MIIIGITGPTGAGKTTASYTMLPEMLDCMCLAGAGGIALGRLASFFNSSDRGQIIESLKSLPFVYPVTNAVSGALEYRLATFVLQSMVALLLFWLLFPVWLLPLPTPAATTLTLSSTPTRLLTLLLSPQCPVSSASAF